VTKTYNGWEALIVVFGVFAIMALVVVLFNWPVMILFGIVHTFWPAVPALGFWHTLIVSILVRLLTWNSSYNTSS
jgi:hypothetical protein